MAGFVFGIDGGATKARLRLQGLDGEPLYFGEGGGTNLHASPIETVRERLSTLFSRAFAETGLHPRDCAAGCVGSAGLDRSAEKAVFEPILRQASRTVCPVLLTCDPEIALVGGLGREDGMILMAGTGSIAFGRARDGTRRRAGGWGYLLGDEGSACWIALSALHAAIRSWEGRGPATRLMDEALRFFETGDPFSLIPRIYGMKDKSEIARFAPSVAALREQGDAAAEEIFTRAAEELSLLGIGLVEMMHPPSRPLDAAPDAPQYRRMLLAGGLLENDSWLRDETARRLLEAIPDLELPPRLADAAAGACMLARTLAGWR